MRIEARQFLKYSTDELWEILTGRFTLVMDDGEEVETNASETCYSSYLWDMIREFPQTPLTANMHITKIMDGGTLSMSTWSDLFSNVVWGVYLHCIKLAEFSDLKKQVELRGYLSKRLYDCYNQAYNDLTIRTESCAVSMLIEDLLEVTNHPKLVELHSQPNYTESDIEAGYDLAKQLLIKEPEAAKKAANPSQADLYTNMLSRIVRGGYVDLNQVNQCVVFRGFITDIDSSQFSIPITSNLVMGMRTMYESLIESRSASKALAFQSKPLQMSEFFNRRSQMGGMAVKHLFPGDCGSTHYLNWTVGENDLPNLEGINYLDENTGQLNYIRRSDKHLIGQTLKTRNPAFCMHPHPNGICETCFGQMSHSVYRRTNIGFSATSFMNEIVSQATLKVKHLDGSSIIRPMFLDEESRKFIGITRSGDGYTLQNAHSGKDFWLIIRPEEIPGIVYVRSPGSIRDLSITRTSMLRNIAIETKVGTRVVHHEISVGVLRRPASFTVDMLEYIREVGWEVDTDGFYRINLKGWDSSKVMMSVPRRNFNVSRYLDRLTKMLNENFSNCWKILLGSRY